MSCANPCQSMPIHANLVPIGGQFFLETQIFQFANLSQSNPIWCQLANLVPIRLQSANPVPISQSGANSPIQRQSCAEIAYYGMPVGPSVNGRAVDRCNATESGLAQHWSALASSPANPGNSNLSNKLLCGLLIGLLGG